MVAEQIRKTDFVLLVPIDWEKLGFEMIDPQPNWPFLYNLRFTAKLNDKQWVWEGPQITNNRSVAIRLEAGCFHYGHEYFEGMAAHKTKDGRCLLFRPEANAKRAALSARTICLPIFPEKMFVEAAEIVTAVNLSYLPPYGTGCRLYIRAFCIGTNPQMGLGPSTEAMMIFYAYPVGNYYPTGLKPMSLYCSPRYDRVAERGMGKAKAGGNYAASYQAKEFAKSKDCGEFLYLDIATRQFITESGSSNFFALRADKSYVTPDEPSVLDSITNDCLAVIAKDLMGFNIQKRRLALKELGAERMKKKSLRFLEAALCGTAARLTPVDKIIYENKGGKKRREIVFPATGENGGPWCRELYNHLTAIQHGDEEDRWDWTMEVRPKQIIL